MSERPSTAGYFKALGRQGLTDLQDYVLNPWQQQVATNDALGTIGHPTPQEVTDEMGTVYGNHDDYLDQVAEQEIEPPEQELEIEDD